MRQKSPQLHFESQADVHLQITTLTCTYTSERSGPETFFGSEGPSTAQPPTNSGALLLLSPPAASLSSGTALAPELRRYGAWGLLPSGVSWAWGHPRHGRAAPWAGAAESLGDLPSARALPKQRGFCSGDPRRSGSGQGQWDVEVKGRGSPACTHTGPSRGTGSTGKHARVPPPASLPAHSWLQPGPPVGELRHPARGCSQGPFPTGQLILA